MEGVSSLTAEFAVAAAVVAVVGSGRARRGCGGRGADVCADLGSCDGGVGGGVCLRRGVGDDGRRPVGQRQQRHRSPTRPGRQRASTARRSASTAPAHASRCPNSGLAAAHHRDDARGLGQPDHRLERLARRDREGQRQLLPDGDDRPQQSARGRGNHRRQLRRGIRDHSAGGEHLDASRLHLRRRQPAPLRQRDAGRDAGQDRCDHLLHQRAHDRQRPVLRPVLQRHDRRPAHLQHRPHPGADPDRHDHPGRLPGTGHDSALGARHAQRDRDQRDPGRSQLGRGDRQHRRHRLPDRTLPGRRLHHLHPDRHHHNRHQLQRHHHRRRHQLQLPRPRQRRRPQPRPLLQHRHRHHTDARHDPALGAGRRSARPRSAPPGSISAGARRPTTSPSPATRSNAARAPAAPPSPRSPPPQPPPPTATPPPSPAPATATASAPTTPSPTSAPTPTPPPSPPPTPHRRRRRRGWPQAGSARRRSCSRGATRPTTSASPATWCT